MPKGKAKGKIKWKGKEGKGLGKGAVKNTRGKLGRKSRTTFHAIATIAERKGARPRSVARTNQRARQGGIAQDLGEIYLCAVEEVWEVGAGQIKANIPGGLPP